MTWEMTPGGKTRARGAGIPFQGTPGKENAITDVEGVRVGLIAQVVVTQSLGDSFFGAPTPFL